MTTRPTIIGIQPPIASCDLIGLIQISCSDWKNSLNVQFNWTVTGSSNEICISEFKKDDLDEGSLFKFG